MTCVSKCVHVCSSLFRRLARSMRAGQGSECQESTVSAKSEGSAPSDEALQGGSRRGSPCVHRGACVTSDYQQVVLL